MKNPADAASPGKTGIADRPLGDRASYETENTPPGKTPGYFDGCSERGMLPPLPTEKGLIECTKGPRNITGNVQLYLS